MMLVIASLVIFSDARAEAFWQPALYVYTTVGNTVLYTLLYQAVNVHTWTAFGIDFALLFQFNNVATWKKRTIENQKYNQSQINQNQNQLAKNKNQNNNNPPVSLLATIGEHLTLITVYFLSLLLYTLFSESRSPFWSAVGKTPIYPSVLSLAMWLPLRHRSDCHSLNEF